MSHKAMTHVWLPGLAAVLLCGCGSGGSISGVVTYDGKPVEKGQITFLPADGKGSEAAGPIAAGKYSVNNITPGPKVVSIVAVKDVPFARSTDDMAKAAAEAAAKGNQTGLIDPADIIPSNATGNNAPLDVQEGTQKHDFNLTPPAGKKP